MKPAKERNILLAKHTRCRLLTCSSRRLLLAAVTALVGVTSSFAAEPAAEAVVTVDPSKVLGPIKPMNAVCNGPSVKKPGGDQKRGNFDDYRAARIPYARTHDSINCVSGGAHTCDISAIFPDFEADETNPKNYDFVFTDYYLDNIRRAGTEVFFRLGQTIEHGPKKYGILPPKDYAKWARVCEHVIRHYNEGWGWGLDDSPTTRNIVWSNQFNIVYWEIWNEADLDPTDGEVVRNPRNWGGTVTNFFEFYEAAAKHLKGKFPHLKIGGPSQAGNNPWSHRFLAWCRDRNIPLDFFSWHCYARNPVHIAERAAWVRGLLDEYGFSKTESILNEYNYVKGWTDDWVYSLRAISGDLNVKGAAFVASTMVQCQSQPLDMLMYYNASAGSLMNVMFDRITLWPRQGYYAFYLWSKLADYGEQVACSLSEGTGEDCNANTGNVEKKDVSAAGQFAAVAAKGADGSGAVMVVRYSDDDNVSDTAKVTVRVNGKSLSRARCLVTDMVRCCTEVPLTVNPDGSAVVRMQPLSFAFIEY